MDDLNPSAAQVITADKANLLFVFPLYIFWFLYIKRILWFALAIVA